MNNCPEDMVPKVGMRFNVEQHAYDFYNAYAGKLGFSI
jgi:zinc finger SWIM domain-containing protein 3